MSNTWLASNSSTTVAVHAPPMASPSVSLTPQPLVLSDARLCLDVAATEPVVRCSVGRAAEGQPDLGVSLWAVLHGRYPQHKHVVLVGDPLADPVILSTLRCLQSLGYWVRLEDAGTQPARLAQVLRAGLLQHYCLDMNRPWQQYGAECAVMVQTSLALLRRATIPVSIRTVVSDACDDDDLLACLLQAPANVDHTLVPHAEAGPEVRSRCYSLAVAARCYGCKCRVAA